MNEEDTGLTMEEFLNLLEKSPAIPQDTRALHENMVAMVEEFRPDIPEADRLFTGTQVENRMFAYANNAVGVIVTMYEMSRKDPDNPGFDWIFTYVTSMMRILVGLSMWKGYVMGKEGK